MREFGFRDRDNNAIIAEMDFTFTSPAAGHADDTKRLFQALHTIIHTYTEQEEIAGAWLTGILENTSSCGISVHWLHKKRISTFINSGDTLGEYTYNIQDEEAGSDNQKDDCCFIFLDCLSLTAYLPCNEVLDLPLPVGHDTTLFLVEHYQGKGRLSIFNFFRSSQYSFSEEIEAYFTALLQIIQADPHLRIADLDILSLEKKINLLNGSCRKVAYPEHATILDLFEEQVRIHPDKIAVSFNGTNLTYKELNERADRIGHYLSTAGIAADSLVPVCMERGIDLIVGMLGVLKAGGAYVPIDPDYPPERISFILDDLDAHLILVAHQTAGLFADKPSLQLIYPVSPPNKDVKYPECKPPRATGSHHLAYCIYTSGSTGQPKGVLVEHRNVVRLFTSEEALFDFSSNDIWTLFHSICFDFSVWEIYGALLFGGLLIIAPAEDTQNLVSFARLMVRQQVTVLNITPSAFYILEELAPFLYGTSHLRYIIFGGEALDPSRLKKWRQASPGCRLINMYGITETTVHVTFQELDDTHMNSHKSMIGQPIPTLGCLILNEAGHLVPAGIPGEMYVWGEGLARGYLNRPELTAQRFLTKSFDRITDLRLYRSGDKVRRFPDGTLEYLGRLDQQVKIRGFRIELGEVEYWLMQSGMVKQGVALSRADHSGHQQLTVYIVVNNSYSKQYLMDYLISKLPHYMIPSLVMEIPGIPTTVNNKVNKRALLELEPKTIGKITGIVSGNIHYDPLLHIWRTLFGLEDIGVEDNFFELGGHSLLAMQMASMIKRALSIDIHPDALSKYPNIKMLTAAMAEGCLHKPGEINKEIIEAKPFTDKGNHYYEISPIQYYWANDSMDSEFKENDNIHGAVSFTYEIYGEYDPKLLERSILYILARHESLRSSFHNIGGKFFMSITPVDKISAPFEFYDYSRPSAIGRTLEELIEFSDHRFHLSHPPLWLIRLIKQTPHKYLLSVKMHHIISDGVSITILMSELTKVYLDLSKGMKPVLPSLEVQYKEYMAQYNKYTEDHYEEHKKFWTIKYPYLPPKLHLPGERAMAKTDIKEKICRSFSIKIPPPVFDRLLSFSKDSSTTLFVVLQATVKLYLASITRQQDILIGTYAYGRDFPGSDNQIGCYAKTVLVRTVLDAGDSLSEAVRKVKHSNEEMLKYRAYTLFDLIDAQYALRNEDSGQFWNINIQFRDLTAGSMDEFLLSDIRFIRQHGEGNSLIPLDMQIEFTHVKKGLSLSALYDSSRYTEEDIQSFVSLYLQFISLHLEIEEAGVIQEPIAL